MKESLYMMRVDGKIYGKGSKAFMMALFEDLLYHTRNCTIEITERRKPNE